MSASLKNKSRLPQGRNTVPAPRLWTRVEYHRAADLELFRPDERLELLQGEIVVKVAPQKSTHFSTIEAGSRALEAAFVVRQQGPFICYK